MSSTVSVIIPVHNSQDFLAETLESVSNQSYKNIEVIIVDDHSSDKSFEIAKSFETNSIRVFKNKGKGACAARNYGFQLSKGEFIQFLDADDLLSESKIQKQVEVLIHNPKKLAVCSTAHFYKDPLNSISKDEEFLFSTDAPSEFFTRLWKGKNHQLYMVQTSAWLTPRELINTYGLWDETLKKDQDGEFFARIGLNSEGIMYVPDITNYYRKHIHSKNIAAQKKREHLESNLKATILKEKYLLKISNDSDAKKAMAKQYKQVAIDSWPNFKDIHYQAIDKCKDLGGSSFEPVLGGRAIEMVKKMFGWKIAKTLSFYGHKFLKAT